MEDTRAFAPFYKVSVPGASGQTGTLYPSVTVAATAGGANPSAVIPGFGSGGTQLQIANTSVTAWAYVNVGAIRDAQAVAAATVAASFPVPPQSVRVVSVDPEVNGASVIMGAGTANVIFTRGQGV